MSGLIRQQGWRGRLVIDDRDNARGVSSKPKDPKKEQAAQVRGRERAMLAQLVRAARARGEDITGPKGLLKSNTATVLEAALAEEMTDHLGHDKHRAPPGGSSNIRSGTRGATDCGGFRVGGQADGVAGLSDLCASMPAREGVETPA